MDEPTIDSRALELERAPSVTLATPTGPRAFKIPKLVLLQAMEATPAISAALPALSRIMSLRAQVQREADVAKIAAASGAAPPLSTIDDTFEWIKSLAMSREEYRGMVDAIFWGLMGGTPGLKRTEFDQFRMSLQEVLSTFMVVVEQSDLLQFRAKGPAEADTAGEPAQGNPSAQ